MNIYVPSVTWKMQEARKEERVGYWLLTLNAMIFVMVILGGITRLTDSGLSIMEWAPILGTLPPFSHSEWQRLFDLYQTTLQFHQINADMNLEGFKDIFWWEYAHRLWGRIMGLVFILPVLYFTFKGYLNRNLIKRLGFILCLGMVQGFIGWIMVASGFGDRTEVSQYRLALHLALALLLYAVIFWQALNLLFSHYDQAVPSLHRHGGVALLLIAFEIVVGAFVAGLNGGLIYNNFPMMGEGWLAPDIFILSPWWINFFENPIAAQFLHRLCAGFVAIAVISLTIRVRKSDLPSYIKRRFYLVPLMLAIQAFLGISTLILAVPIVLAVAHQAGALLLLTAMLFALHALRQPRIN